MWPWKRGIDPELAALRERVAVLEALLKSQGENLGLLNRQLQAAQARFEETRGIALERGLYQTDILVRLAERLGVHTGDRPPDANRADPGIPPASASGADRPVPGARG
jgi:hypothetical protein